MCQSDACDVGGIYTKHARIVFAIAQKMATFGLTFNASLRLKFHDD